MAPTLFYHHVRVRIGVTDPLVLQAVRGTLYHLGCRDMAFTDSLEAIRSAVVNEPVDLLIVAMELGDGVTGMISQIRHGDLGDNPFVPIVAVTSNPSREVVLAGVDCGVDDLIPYPWTTGYLDERLGKLIMGRRPFVVTSDYIGPDRRAAMRPGQPPVQALHVPNPLRAKALDRMSDEDLRKAIDASAAVLNADKIRRLSELVVRLVNELENRVSDGDAMSSLSEACLDKMLTATESIVKRAAGTAYAPAATLCRTLQATARKLRDGMEVGEAPDPAALRPLIDRFIKQFQVDPAIASIGLPAHLLQRLPDLKLRDDVA
ncbi:response regulator [Novispirillum sp. DQ9]|uniref:response regulator n=1 Tax=Novispirillum sp. DQ9 TaxID=3398612 RepID=UPI003C7A35AD